MKSSETGSTKRVLDMSDKEKYHFAKLELGRAERLLENARALDDHILMMHGEEGIEFWRHEVESHARRALQEEASRVRNTLYDWRYNGVYKR